MVLVKGKGKGLPQQAEVAQGVLGRLRSRIFLTISTTRVVSRTVWCSHIKCYSVIYINFIVL